MLIFFQVVQDENIGIFDLESPVEHVDNVSNRQILGSVELWFINVTSRFGDPGTHEELTSEASSVASRHFVNHEGVRSKAEVDYELAVCVLILIIVILQTKRH